MCYQVGSGGFESDCTVEIGGARLASEASDITYIIARLYIECTI